MTSNLKFTLDMTEEEARNLWKACNESLALRWMATVGAKSAFTVSMLETAIERLVHETKPLTESKLSVIVGVCSGNNPMTSNEE